MKTKEKQAILDAIMEKANVGQNYTTAGDGGNAINPALLDLIPPNTSFGGIYDRCSKISTSRNKVNVPTYNTTTVDDGGQFGSLAQWLVEGEAYDLEKMSLDQKQLTLRKLGIVIPITEELAEDAEAFVGIVRRVMIDNIRYQLERALIYGNGGLAAGGVVGTNDHATIYVSGAGNVAADLVAVLSSYYGGDQGVWVLSHDVFADIVSSFASDISYNPASGLLYGYPVLIARSANAGCMMLADWSQYLLAQRDIKTAVGESIYFQSDQLLLKANIRVQGTPNWSSTQTLEDGSVVAPFVALSDMNAEESSEEEWNFSSSSSSSSIDSSSSSSKSSSSSSVDSSSSSSFGITSSSSSSSYIQNWSSSSSSSSSSSFGESSSSESGA
jgi:HK97 family phage major capsid protein